MKHEIAIRHERELSLELMSSALENSRSLVVVVDRRGVLKYINAAFRDFTGQLPGSLDGCQLSDLEPYFHFPAVDEDEFLSFVKTQQKVELCGYDSGRNSYWFQATISPIFGEDNAPTHYVIVCEDVTRMKQRQDEMERLAFYDPLTGLENRVLFKHNMNKVLEHAKRDNARSALLFIDLDHFKEVNDTYGHEAGDMVLKTIATRIRNQVRESDSVARISGDEFAILLVDIKTNEDAVRIASYVLQECVKPVKYQNHTHTVSASIGISITPDDAITCDDLIRCADLAMYKAKRQGRNNYHFYSSATQSASIKKVDLENDIRDSIAENQFSFEYQPQVCLKSNSIRAVEALVRWNRQDGSVTLPEDFIEVAESTGLMFSLGEWMVNEIERTRAHLHEAGMLDVKVSVNLSPKQFHDERFVALLKEVARNHHGEVSDVQIEVKEKALFDNPEESLQKLQNLKELGYSISIDDFGTGYLSLSYLRRFPVDAIKIDKSLITRLPVDQEAVEITLALIAMAHKLKIEVIAEGVESEEQMRFLKNNGCDMAQGYFFSHAVSLKDFISRHPILH